MSDNKVVALVQRSPLSFPAVPGIVERLEALLELAKRGHIQGFVYAISKYTPPETVDDGCMPGWVAACGVALDGELDTDNRISTGLLMLNKEFVDTYLSKNYAASSIVSDCEAARGGSGVRLEDDDGSNDDEPA